VNSLFVVVVVVVVDRYAICPLSCLMLAGFVYSTTMTTSVTTAVTTTTTTQVFEPVFLFFVVSHIHPLILFCIPTHHSIHSIRITNTYYSRNGRNIKNMQLKLILIKMIKQQQLNYVVLHVHI
jgi:hypothetical protein